MHNYFKSLATLFFCLITSCFANEGAMRPSVIVSVAPYKNIVEQIAGPTLDVYLMVPAGASSHTFEPTPKQMLQASKAEMWFQIGEEFEPKAGRALQSHNPTLTFVDLREGVELINASGEGHSCCTHCHGGCADPHFWLSPKEVAKQVAVIARELSKKYPQYKQLYQKNALAVTDKLQQLNEEMKKILSGAKKRTVLVSHPAYGYLCRDFHLKQLSVEFEGKDPTSKQLTNILLEAREQQLERVFIQMQYNSKGARLIAAEIGAHVVVLDPYSENYFESMLEIARSFAN